MSGAAGWSVVTEASADREPSQGCISPNSALISLTIATVDTIQSGRRSVNSLYPPSSCPPQPLHRPLRPLLRLPLLQLVPLYPRRAPT